MRNNDSRCEVNRLGKMGKKNCGFERIKGIASRYTLSCSREVSTELTGSREQVEALELNPVEKADQVPTMVHGSYYRLWRQIGMWGIL